MSHIETILIAGVAISGIHLILNAYMYGANLARGEQHLAYRKAEFQMMQSEHIRLMSAHDEYTEEKSK